MESRMEASGGAHGSSLVQHCQFKLDKRTRCGRIAQVWVKRSWIGGYNQQEHEQTLAACSGHAQGLEVVGPIVVGEKS